MPDGRAVLFCYNLLGAPSKLFARLCDAFLVYLLYLIFFNDFSETNYLTISLTDFRNLFT